MTTLSIKSLIDSFIESLFTEKGFSDNTGRAYLQDLEEFLAFFSKNRASVDKKKEDVDSLLIEDIDRLVIRGYLGFLHKKKNKKTSIARKLSALRSFFNFLVKRGVVSKNPADSVVTPKTEKSIPVYLPVDDMFRLLDSINTDTLLGIRNLAIFETFYSTGVRVSELSGMNTLDVDFSENMVRVKGKGNKERIVPIGNKAVGSIKTYRERLEKEMSEPRKESSIDNGPLFLNKNYGRLSSRSIGRVLKKIALECGLSVPVSPPALRHTFATHMLDAGADMRSVQEILGHSSLSTTQKYTHVTIDRLMEAYDKAHPRK